jgi:ribonuclease BN (tRNA processing enzyme)
VGNRIVLLGTGTCQLQEHRAASAVLVELGSVRLVHDFGRGTCLRLTTHGLRQDDIEHVVLSHFHPDHLSDLVPYLHAASWSRIDPRRRDLHIYGPAGLEVQLMRLLSLFEADTLVRQEHFRVILHEVRGEDLVIGNRKFFFQDLPPAGNHGVKWSCGGRMCALTGDCDYHDQEVEFLRGTDLAVIDAGHVEDDEIVELAARTGVARLICSHLYRELDEQVLNERARELGYRGRLIVGRDLMSFELAADVVDACWYLGRCLSVSTRSSSTTAGNSTSRPRISATTQPPTRSGSTTAAACCSSNVSPTKS